MTIVDLPEDVWQIVALFFPQRELSPLISVNKALYNIVLNAKYREIHWDKVDKDLARTLVRLRTPCIAQRVRRLHVRAWFIEYLNRKEAQSRPSAMATSKRWLNRHLRLPSRLSHGAKGNTTYAEDIMEAMTEALSLMSQVTEYTFEWRDLSPNQRTLRLLSTARSAFGISLRKLTLNAQLENFRALVSTVEFENLEDLELYFDHDNIDLDVEETLQILQNTIAPFMNHFRRTISSLFIFSASKADLSSLFPALDKFPRLYNLIFHLPWDSAHLSEPDALIGFLRRNTEMLRSIELGKSYAAVSELADAPTCIWSQFSRALLSDPRVLTDLTILKIPAFESFEETLACINYSAHTLRTLHLVDYFFGEDELLAFVQLFARRNLDSGLRTLYIGLSTLTVSTIDLLARRLPALDSLGLVLAEYVASEIMIMQHNVLVLQASPFCMSLAAHSFPEWGLANIGIWSKRFIETPYSTPEETAIMLHIARCFPSIRSFKALPRSTSAFICPAFP
ncbi:unnamed protein product [Mycena citricolor]|uniref:F-box domain-containing protein n=2 Tax=Mycena citricolor TaxID=2018698 RepID=A0AAD2GUA3_9AGAR|nr:unnamed protein product [Mycena citricolor]